MPIALVPLSLATLVLIFGRQIEAWMIDNSDPRAAPHRADLLADAALGGRPGHQHHGPQRPLPLRHQAPKEHWAWVAPGAIAGTLIWFPVTLAFGWYVTRIADYSMFYGSFGAGIATLVWLYITAFSVLLGAELNGALFRERQVQASTTGSSGMILFQSVTSLTGDCTLQDA